MSPSVAARFADLPLANLAGGGCNSAGGVAANPGLAAFRAGVDGTLPLPTPSAAKSPIVPVVGQETRWVEMGLRLGFRQFTHKVTPGPVKLAPLLVVCKDFYKLASVST